MNIHKLSSIVNACRWMKIRFFFFSFLFLILFVSFGELSFDYVNWLWDSGWVRLMVNFRFN